MCKNSCQRLEDDLSSPNYAIYVNNILRSLLVGFFTKKSRDTIAVTLWKMKEITDKVFKQVKLNRFSLLGFIFSRFAIAAEDNLLIEIFKLYYANENLKQITIGESLIELS
jgi:hypothetical protein